jgi:hypothetical protein
MKVPQGGGNQGWPPGEPGEGLCNNLNVFPASLKEVQTLNGGLVAINRFIAKHAERSLPFIAILKKLSLSEKIPMDRSG